MARAPGWYVALATAVALGAAGCGTASPESPPTGVDQLVIPTPSPDPADFVAAIDNPWLPYATDHQWRYAVRIEGQDYVRTVTVDPERTQVAGVTTTVVDTTTSPVAPGTPAPTRDYYAQDRHGNVWWFGREGEWRAGEGGAEAGLAMPGHPRLGDGWRMAFQRGLVDVRASVATTDQTVTTPSDTFQHLLGLDVSSALQPGHDTRAFYARGIGLVEEVSTDGPASFAELESGP